MIEQSITEPVIGFDQRRPGLASTDAVADQTAGGLELGDLDPSLLGEDPRCRGPDWEADGKQPSVQVIYGVAATPEVEGEVVELLVNR